MQKKPVQNILITSDKAGQRIDNFLLTRLKSVPKSRIYQMLRKGEVRVNKKRVKPLYRLEENDQLRLPPVTEAVLKPKNPPNESFLTFLSQRILYEDEFLLVINKPSGIPVHGGNKISVGMIEALRSLYPHLSQLELVHRLDAETSGCLVIAKKRSVLRELHECWRQGRVLKIYQALTLGHWQEKEYRVESNLLKNQLKSGERVVRVDPLGKPSLTIFKPLKVFKETTLVEALLKTGRTHQIRVQAALQSHPLAQDEKYGNKLFNKKMSGLGLKRLFLHAYLIEFSLPSKNLHIKVVAPFDTDLIMCLKALEQTD